MTDEELFQQSEFAKFPKPETESQKQSLLKFIRIVRANKNGEPVEEMTPEEKSVLIDYYNNCMPKVANSEEKASPISNESFNTSVELTQNNETEKDTLDDVLERSEIDGLPQEGILPSQSELKQDFNENVFDTNENIEELGESATEILSEVANDNYKDVLAIEENEIYGEEVNDTINPKDIENNTIIPQKNAQELSPKASPISNESFNTSVELTQNDEIEKDTLDYALEESEIDGIPQEGILPSQSELKQDFNENVFDTNENIEELGESTTEILSEVANDNYKDVLAIEKNEISEEEVNDTTNPKDIENSTITPQKNAQELSPKASPISNESFNTSVELSQNNEIEKDTLDDVLEGSEIDGIPQERILPSHNELKQDFNENVFDTNENIEELGEMTTEISSEPAIENNVIEPQKNMEEVSQKVFLISDEFSNISAKLRRNYKIEKAAPGSKMSKDKGDHPSK